MTEQDKSVLGAHMLGKLLSRLGENRVLWGTDSV
jgi:hypothetical protein